MVGSEDPPPMATWWIKANHERFCVTIVQKEEDRKGGKGKKGSGGSDGILQRKGGVPPLKSPLAPPGAGRGVKRAIQDNNSAAERHNMAADDEPIFYANNEEEEQDATEQVNVDPYTEPQGVQEVGGVILPQASGAASSLCPPQK